MEYYLPRILQAGIGPNQPPVTKDIIINGIPLFDNIQIQTIEFCNLKCDFCPNHYLIWDRLDDKRNGTPYKLMSIENYTKLIKNLADLNYSGRISPYLMNEPLMDKERMVEIIGIAKEYLPNSYLTINTNGTGLTVDLMQGMIDAGMDRIQIDDYFDDKYATRMLKVMEHFQTANCNIILSSNYNVKQARNREDKNKVPHYGPYTYWNRGGLVNVNPDIPVPQKNCKYPNKHMFIKWDGSALLCCCDWEYKVVHGNVFETSVEEVWTNGSYQHYRDTLAKGRRDLLKMCRKCNFGGAESEDERLEEFQRQEKYGAELV